MKKPVLSICIPTYNRGEFAYAAAKHLLDNWAGDEIEVVISDNNSEDNTQQLIESIKDCRLKYYRNEENLGAAFNTHLSFLRATGEYAYLTSDEDDLDIKQIPYLLDFFKNNPNVSVFVGGGDLTYTQKRFPDAVYTNAFEALKAIAFKTRYMTGIIMNQRLYTEEMQHIGFKESAEVWDAYSFMYAMARLCCRGAVVTSSHLLFSLPRLTMTDVSNNARKDGIYYYEPEGRINQMYTWSKAICGLDISDYEKAYMVVKIIFDTVELATRLFNTGYVEEVRKTVPASDFDIYQRRISSLNRKELTDRILHKGNVVFAELFGTVVDQIEDCRIVEYYKDRLKEL